jgi:hypothetical protein
MFAVNHCGSSSHLYLTPDERRVEYLILAGLLKSAPVNSAENGRLNSSAVRMGLKMGIATLMLILAFMSFILVTTGLVLIFIV